MTGVSGRRRPRCDGRTPSKSVPFVLVAVQIIVGSLPGVASCAVSRSPQNSLGKSL
jgi:hypothetical protein